VARWNDWFVTGADLAEHEGWGVGTGRGGARWANRHAAGFDSRWVGNLSIVNPYRL